MVLNGFRSVDNFDKKLFLHEFRNGLAGKYLRNSFCSISRLLDSATVMLPNLTW
jgi:hypothetical protein